MEISEKEYLETLIKPIHNDIKDIKAQTLKTNGRVNRLESWRDRIIGAGTVITVIYGLTLFIISKYF